MGKFDAPGHTEKAQTAPPRTEEELISFLNNSGQKRPANLPSRNIDAAHWWMGIIEQPREHERPREVALPGGQGMRWVCPYTDRAVYTLRRFMALEDPDQKYIIGARGDDIYWRGDDMKFFRGLYEETMNMRDIGREKYIAKAKNVARRFVRL